LQGHHPQRLRFQNIAPAQYPRRSLLEGTHEVEGPGAE
jgi:hypothetical protein